MTSDHFRTHLTFILDWWEFMVDWENGGVFTNTRRFARERKDDRKVLLMHLRQMYNYSVGHERDHPLGERVARHLRDSLDAVFPDKDGGLFVTPVRYGTEPVVDGYTNAYAVIGLSRFARAFRCRESAERALEIYRLLDGRLTDGELADRGTWDVEILADGRRSGKSDNALIHRCEGTLNLLRALDAAAPGLADRERDFLETEIDAMTRFFDARIARPEAGYTVETLQDDALPLSYNDDLTQSLAHAFEWIGFCFEIEAHTRLTLPFLDTRGRELARNALRNGLAENGCYRNDFVPRFRDGRQQAAFWPQVEAPLGVLWARKRWGDRDFPLENAERMLAFYERHFYHRPEYGGGILSSVAENGVPIGLKCGYMFKCDHHAVRMCEKALEYGLTGGDAA